MSEQEAFEAKFKYLSFARKLDAWGEKVYASQAVQDLWEGWQARASLPSNPEHDTEGAIKAAFEAKYSSSAEDPACAEELRLFRDGWLEHDTYGAPPVGALTDEQKGIIYDEWRALGNDGSYGELIDMVERAALAAAPAPESAGCRWPWLKCGSPAPCDVCGSPTPAPSEAVKGVSDNPADDNYLCPAGRVQQGLPPFTPVKGVSTAEPLAVAKKALEEIDNLSGGECFEYRTIALEALAKLERLAAPSHPPAMAAVFKWPDFMDPKQGPAVAVQAEPAGFEDWLDNHEFNYPRGTPIRYTEQHLREAFAAGAAHPKPAAPIDMILHCPSCGLQHVDAPEDLPMPPPGSMFEGSAGWTNPPHRSHLCHGCGHIWRPADVPTNGVKAIKTKGKADGNPAAPAGVEGHVIDLIADHGADTSDTVSIALYARRWKAIAAALRSQPAAVQSEPAGWKLVPIDPTKAMRRAGGDHFVKTSGHWSQVAGGAYREMLAVAPTHPKPAAPATADEAVSDEAIETILFGVLHTGEEGPPGQVPYWREWLQEIGLPCARAILALRSGASAQPAGGAK